MDEFTLEFIAEQLALAAKATPRPWAKLYEFNIAGASGNRSVAACGGYSQYPHQELAHNENTANTDYIIAAANNYPAALEEIARLREALEEIRDLARTGLPPAGWEETYWLFHKSNRIAGMADAALKGQEAEGKQMDTLTEAVMNVLRMIEGWSGDPETAAALLDEIHAELERGLGATVEPPQITPEQRKDADEFLRGLFGGEE